MSNFELLKPEWPTIRADPARAESDLAPDPVAACFYARRTVEQLVGHLDDLLGLIDAYCSDLAARINEPVFKAQVGVGITQKLNLIRKQENLGSHGA